MMANSAQNPLSASKRNQLLNRIDELEKILIKKKAQRKNTTTKLRTSTEDIPVLVEEIISDSSLIKALNRNDPEKNHLIINDIVAKIDKEIGQELDELIVMLKNSIINEVKTRLLKELQLNQSGR